jgi:MarR family
MHPGQIAARAAYAVAVITAGSGRTVTLAELDAAASRLADRLGLTTRSVASMLDRLEKTGYVTRSPHPSDRRSLPRLLVEDRFHCPISPVPRRSSPSIHSDATTTSVPSPGATFPRHRCI